MSILKREVARVFKPLLAPARYKGAYGGRGSGKSHFFAEELIMDSLAEPGNTGEGLRSVCIREVLKDLSDSAKRLLEDKLAKFNLGEADGFKVFRNEIQTPKDGVIIFRGMQDQNAESIKSLEKFKKAWIEEAQTLSTRSLTLLRPTIRAEESEIWASWNPRRKTDAIDDFLRKNRPDSAVVIQANWRDNPWFPAVLEEERLHDKAKYPDRYDHIWEGDYAKVYEGAYYAGLLSEAKRQGRIGKVAADPLLPLRAFIDIGGAGATADAFTIWIVQWVASEIRVLDYYESVGQVLAYHVNWLRSKGYQDAIIYLPHDGVNVNNITGKRYKDHFEDAGFNVEPPIPNQGRGAASMRIEALRRLGPQLWFNEETTEAGREALAFYHEKRDEERQIGLGPEHDWSSHAADSLGMMAVCYEPPAGSARVNRKIDYPSMGYV